MHFVFICAFECLHKDTLPDHLGLCGLVSLKDFRTLGTGGRRDAIELDFLLTLLREGSTK